ncbi:MAG: glycosyltransferase [Methanosphaera sp.]|uniref:glycosyltransferase n=1 Tax=Methanosphaera sp. TaxID=2666342 RepID=UPI0025EF98D2|nr:glycosyltransferase [Methanosphaera sp.]MCI5867700.1 glycosyltransferase [Methanosphaera sp.]MDD6534168.1 glycosyltransferase [Methanosphaera sp.]MDY3956023.1 glycosyltransferase [Methanosphaera sp.]
MNILEVIPYFTFARGGDVAVCYNLTRQFTDKGHDVTILTTNFEYNKEDTDTIDNLQMVNVDYKFNFALFIYSPQMKKWLDENIKNFDIIHMHELRSYQNIVVMEYAKKYNIPYIIQPHASTPTNVGQSLFKKLFDVFFGNKLMQNASHIIAVSDYEAKYDKLMTNAPVEVVYNGMNVDEFENIDSYDTFLEGIPYILYFGRLDSLKGINYIIEAFAQLPDEFREYKLVIAGKISDYKKTLDEIITKYDIKDRVIFTGFVDEADKNAIYRDAKLFVNPVKYMGGVALTVFESILAGTPVVVTRQSGEVIEKIDAGIIVEYADIEQLKDAIITSLTDTKLTQRQLENGQNYIKNNLQWCDVADHILEIYEKYIKKGE